MPQKVTRKNGVTVLNTPGQINPIAREPHDNTTDLEMAVLKAKTKRKWQAPESTIPGRTRTAPPSSEGTLPS
jgi:hypothetical protein